MVKVRGFYPRQICISVICESRDLLWRRGYSFFLIFSTDFGYGQASTVCMSSAWSSLFGLHRSFIVGSGG